MFSISSFTEKWSLLPRSYQIALLVTTISLLIHPINDIIGIISQWRWVTSLYFLVGIPDWILYGGVILLSYHWAFNNNKNAWFTPILLGIFDLRFVPGMLFNFWQTSYMTSTQLDFLIEMYLPAILTIPFSLIMIITNILVHQYTSQNNLKINPK